MYKVLDKDSHSACYVCVMFTAGGVDSTAMLANTIQPFATPGFYAELRSASTSFSFPSAINLLAFPESELILNHLLALVVAQEGRHPLHHQIRTKIFIPDASPSYFFFWEVNVPEPLVPRAFIVMLEAENPPKFETKPTQAQLMAMEEYFLDVLLK